MKELILIQNELKAPKIQYNAHGKYNYRNCEDILEALKPICKEHDRLVTLTDEVVLIGSRFYVKATASYHYPDGIYSVSAYAREPESNNAKMDGSQITGSASSYARKYALNGLFCIDDTKDADTHNDGSGTPKTIKPDNSGNKSKPSGNSGNLKTEADQIIDNHDWPDAKKEAMKKNTHDNDFAQKIINGEIK